MNILILGGTGFLGRNLANELSRFHSVYSVGYDKTNKQTDRCFMSAKLSDTEEIISFIKANKIALVMHLVSTLLPSSNASDYVSDLQDVYIPTLKLLEYCAENHIRFLYFSSGGAVYGTGDGCFSEKKECKPISYYGLSKLNIENAIHFYHSTYGLEYLIVRPSNPYGHGQNIYGKQGLIAVLMGKVLQQKSIEIWGDGTAIKDFIYIDDFVFYVKALLENECAWNETYNIGSGVGTSVNEVLTIFKNIGISLPKIHRIASRKSDVSRMILDCKKINTLFSHECNTIEEGILQFFDFLKEGKNEHN